MKRIYKEIKKGLNPKEFWSKNFSSIFVPFLSLFFIKFKIHPNLITLCMLPLCFVIIFFAIFINNNLLSLLGISITGIIINIIDFIDGTVARHTNKVSKYGKYLDRVCHYSANTTIYLGYGIYCLQTSNELTAFLFFLIAIIELFDSASKDSVYLINLEKTDFSYSKVNKFEFKFTTIRDHILRIFFLPLTSIPHTIVIFFPLFLFFKSGLLIYAILFLIQLIIKTIFRSINIFRNYEKVST